MARYPELEEHSAIVTGADSPVGEAVVRELEGHGVRVTAVPAGPPPAEGAAPASPSFVDKIQDYLADADAVGRTCADVVDKYGGIDLLVHCAGAEPARDAPQIADISDEQWRRAVVSTVRSAFLWAQSVLRHTLARRCGCMIFITAEAARDPARATGIDYAATRGALMGLVRHLAREMGPHCIRVNAVAVADAAAAGVSSLPPLPGCPPSTTGASPGEVAGLVAFLASDGAGYLTGVCLDAFR